MKTWKAWGCGSVSVALFVLILLSYKAASQGTEPAENNGTLLYSSEQSTFDVETYRTANPTPNANATKVKKLTEGNLLKSLFSDGIGILTNQAYQVKFISDLKANGTDPEEFFKNITVQTSNMTQMENDQFIRHHHHYYYGYGYPRYGYVNYRGFGGYKTTLAMAALPKIAKHVTVKNGYSFNPDTYRGGSGYSTKTNSKTTLVGGAKSTSSGQGNSGQTNTNIKSAGAVGKPPPSYESLYPQQSPPSYESLYPKTYSRPSYDFGSYYRGSSIGRLGSSSGYGSSNGLRSSSGLGSSGSYRRGGGSRRRG